MSEETKTPKSANVAGRFNGFVRLLRWPESKRSGRLPWFVTAWRILFYPSLIVSLWIAFVSILCAYGWNEARRWWSNAT